MDFVNDGHLLVNYQPRSGNEEHLLAVDHLGLGYKGYLLVIDQLGFAIEGFLLVIDQPGSSGNYEFLLVINQLPFDIGRLGFCNEKYLFMLWITWAYGGMIPLYH